ncbi:replicative DNA helicase [Paucibacter soli]|uniref:replicative DNA helicase n=1 Tax=Paucibacter soli TaxID=3133433 RepID=UPI0030B51ADF
MNTRVSLFARRGDESDAHPIGEIPVMAEPVAGSSAVQMAERSVVGAILANNALFDAIADVIVASDIASPILSAVFAGIVEIIEGRVDGIDVADTISVASLPSVCQLASTEDLQALVAAVGANPEAAVSHAKVVATASQERKLRAAVTQAQAISAGDTPVEERAGEIQKLLTGATEARSLPIKSIGAAAVEALTEMAERASSGVSTMGITTSYPDLDALTAGLHAGQLIIVAARPAVGKTALVMSLGLGTAAAGTHVLMASMEMKAKELSKRALAIVSGVDSHAIRMGALSEEDWEAIVAGGEELSELPFNVVDMPSVTLTALSALARRLHREGKCDLIIVDYLQLMETVGGKHTNREQEVAAISRGLKKLAMQLGIPVIALSQLNRAVENRAVQRPQMSDLRESGAIEQDADVIIFIHREDDQAELIVEKQREGPTGVVRMGYIQKNTKFVSVNDTGFDQHRLAA